VAALITKKIRLRLIVVPVLFLLVALAAGSMDSIYRFKGVQIPLALKIEGRILEKGTYDLEFLRTSSPVLYHLRIIKKGKILHLVQGQEVPYSGDASAIRTSRDVPDKPTLKMAKNTMRKSFIMTFESGRHTVIFPLIRARFELPYSED